MSRGIPLIANGDAFWEFLTEDFLLPALPRAFVETMEDVSQDCVESLQAVRATFPQRVGDLQQPPGL